MGSVAFSPDGHTLASGSDNGTTQLWNLNVDQAIDRICATTSYNLTPQQWTRYIPNCRMTHHAARRKPPCPRSPRRSHMLVTG